LKALTTTSTHGSAAVNPPPFAANPGAPPPDKLAADNGKLARAIVHALEDMKSEEIVSIDLRGKTTLADLLLVASGRSTTQVGAIAERVVTACKEAGLASPRVEGVPACDWVLIDAGDVIVHVFRPEVRRFYNLEKLWGGDRPAEIASRDRRAV
jgi:ribosome-associated protein